MLSVRDIGELTDGEIRGDETRTVSAVATLQDADQNAISFIAARRYLPYLRSTKAGAVLVTREWEDDVPAGCAAIVVEDPHRSLREVLLKLYPAKGTVAGIHDTAVIAESATVAEGVQVGAYAVIQAGARIESGSSIAEHVVIGPDCVVGENVTIHPSVTLYEGVEIGARSIVHSGARIGKDGFGFVWSDGGHRRVPQVGGCVIGADVEIGANVTIDRGSVGNTEIGDGTKIDNLVHVGHNARIGRHVLLIAQVGISGSTVIGDGAVLAGQVGVAGHLEIGAGARIGAQAGVISDVPGGETYSGLPARPHTDVMRAQAGTYKIHDLMRRVRRIENQVRGKDLGAGSANHTMTGEDGDA